MYNGLSLCLFLQINLKVKLERFTFEEEEEEKKKIFCYLLKLAISFPSEVHEILLIRKKASTPWIVFFRVTVCMFLDISNYVLSQGRGGWVGGWKGRCCSSVAIMKQWLVDPKSSTSPPVRCAAETAIHKLYFFPS